MPIFQCCLTFDLLDGDRTGDVHGFAGSSAVGGSDPEQVLIILCQRLDGVPGHGGLGGCHSTPPVCTHLAGLNDEACEPAGAVVQRLFPAQRDRGLGDINYLQVQRHRWHFTHKHSLRCLTRLANAVNILRQDSEEVVYTLLQARDPQQRLPALRGDSLV